MPDNDLVEIIREVSRGQWIVDRAGSWATVGGVAGDGFEAYARILHPVEARREDLTVTIEWGQHPVVEKSVWTWSMIAERTGRIMHPLVQSRRLTNNEQLMDFDDGWRLHQIPEGWFDPRLLSLLTTHLTTSTPDDIVIAIWNGWALPNQMQAYAQISSDPVRDSDAERWQREFARSHQEALAAVSSDFREAVRSGPHLEFPNRDFVLLQTSLAELGDPDWGIGAGIGWTGGDRDPSPQMVWPEDHAWVVASEIDWDSTIVAGSRSVVDAILFDAALEVFEVNATDDLTWDGDLINPDRTAQG